MILLIRPDGNESDAAALAEVGLASVIAPLLEVVPLPDPGPARLLAEALLEAGPGGWLVLTSPRTWRLWRAAAAKLDAQLVQALNRGTRIATVGPATTASLPWFARQATTTSQGISAEDLLALLLDQYGGTAIIPASTRARPLLGNGLRAAGWRVQQADVYDTRPVAEAPPALAGLGDGSLTAVLVRSPSAADALAQFVPKPVAAKIFAVGPITAARCRLHGWPVVELTSTEPAAVARAIYAEPEPKEP